MSEKEREYLSRINLLEIELDKIRKLYSYSKQANDKARIADEIPIPVARFNRLGQISYMNTAFYELISEEDNQPVEKFNFFKLMKSSDVAALNNLLDGISPGKASHDNEFTLIKRNGDQAPVDIDIRFSPSGDGEQFLASCKDVSYKLFASKKLQKSETRFRSIVENSHDGVIIIDTDYKILYSNKVLVKILGYPIEEIVYSDFRKFLHSSNKNIVTERYQKRQKGEELPTRYNIKAIRKDGEIRILSLSSVVFTDIDGNMRTAAQLLDITETKKAEKKLQQRLRIEKIIADISSNFIEVKAIDKAIKDSLAAIGIFFKAQRVGLYQFSKDRKYINNTNEWKLPEVKSAKNINHNLKVHDIKWLTSLLETGENVIIHDIKKFHGVNNDMKKILIESAVQSLMAFPIFSSSNLMGYITLANIDADIERNEDAPLLRTVAEIIGAAIEKDKAKKSLIQLNTELEQRVKDKTLELEKALEELQIEIDERKTTLAELETVNKELHVSREQISEEAGKLAVLNKKLSDSQMELKELNSTKDKFFSIIAHDMKNPLSGIMNIAELLTEYYDKMEEKEKIRFINMFYDSAKYINTLLENLLQWSRSQTGRMEYAPHMQDLSTIIIETIKFFDPDIKKKNITIKSHIKPGTLAYFDFSMITIVIRNLVSNAIKYSNENSEINLDIKDDEDKYIICVKDNGIGIESENIEKLFRIDMNYSAPGTQNEKGTGLGLILCKEFIDKHEQEIMVSSKPGTGSEFSFTLEK